MTDPSTASAPGSTTSAYVSITPDFVLHERAYAENSVQYDPDLGILTVLRDRYDDAGSVRLVLPVEVDGHAVGVVIESAPRDTRVVGDGRTQVLPELQLFEEMAGELSFVPPPAGANPAPAIKVKITIRTRPKGGG